MKQIQGKQGLVRGIGRFGKPRVREIGIPLYIQLCSDFVTPNVVISSIVSRVILIHLHTSLRSVRAVTGLIFCPRPSSYCKRIHCAVMTYPSLPSRWYIFLQAYEVFMGHSICFKMFHSSRLSIETRSLALCSLLLSQLYKSPLLFWRNM